MRTWEAAVFCLVCSASVAACSGASGGLAQNDAASDSTNGCGAEGEACCNGTACNAGLVCGSGVCSSGGADGGTGTDATVDSAGDSNGPADTGTDTFDSPIDAADCVGGSLSCNGSQPQVCTTTGTWQSVGAPCSGSSPVCLDGGCVACVPGSVQCSASQPQTCTAAGAWQDNGAACSQPMPDCVQGGCACAGTMYGGRCATCGVPGNCVITVPIPQVVTSTSSGTYTLCAPPTSPGQCVLSIDLGNSTPAMADGGVAANYPMKAADLPLQYSAQGGVIMCTVDVAFGAGGCNGNTPQVSYAPVPVQLELGPDAGTAPDGGSPALGCDPVSAAAVTATMDQTDVQICGGLCVSQVNQIKSFIVGQLGVAAQSAISSAIDNQSCLH